MRSTLIVDLFLASFRALFMERNNSTAVDFIDRVADAKKSGENVDEYMSSIADYLAGDAELDFSGLKDRINEEVDELLERGEDDGTAGGTISTDFPDPPGTVVPAE